VLHTIVFNRALGHVRPIDVDSELFDVTYVRGPQEGGRGGSVRRRRQEENRARRRSVRAPPRAAAAPPACPAPSPHNPPSPTSPAPAPASTQVKCGDPDVDARLEAKIGEFVAFIERQRGDDIAQLRLAFYERRRRQAGWFMLQQDERLYWEQW
jgi:hypothetical protein